MHVALAVILVLVGTILFHFLSPWWSTPIASNWGAFDDTITITFWITGAVFIAVILFMAYCLIKYRHREDRRAEYEPENKKLEIWLTAITALGVAGLLAPGLFAWNKYINVPEEATSIEVVGQQWQWTFRLPGTDGKLGRTSTKLISPNNPYGIDPKDPNGLDDVLIDDSELHMVKGKPVKVLLRSVDVLHDFYVPQFRAKMDIIPGSVTYFWVTPTKEGAFDIMCFELCGRGHHAMRGTVVVQTQEAYDKWLGDYDTFSKSLEEANNETPTKPVRLAAKERTATR